MRKDAMPVRKMPGIATKKVTTPEDKVCVAEEEWGAVPTSSALLPYSE
jgi:hypothetical protein